MTDYIEQKLITIFFDGGNIEIRVPLDFKVTDKWLESQIDNSDMVRCEEWLKKKGFTKDEYGKWNLVHNVPFDKKSTKDIKLPLFFYDKEKKDLKVSFGTIIGLRSFILPGFPKENLKFKTFQNFPRNFGQETTLRIVKDINDESIESEFYTFYVGFIKAHRTSNRYCTGIHNSKDYHRLLMSYILDNYSPKEFYEHEWPEGFLDSLTNEEKNYIASKGAVSKYAL